MHSASKLNDGAKRGSMSFQAIGTKRKLLEFRVLMEPEAQRRPRFSSRGKFVKVHQDGADVAFRKMFRQAAEAHRPVTPFACPIALELIFWMHPPKRLVVGRNFPGRPDVDNLQKAVLDAFNPTFRKDKATGERVCTYQGFWQDDAQVVALLGSKLWAGEGVPPGILVVMYEA